VLTELHKLTPPAMARQRAEDVLGDGFDQGRCVMRGSCGTKSPRSDAGLPCPDDSKPHQVRVSLYSLDSLS
jgi:hypothetical protein